MNISGFQHFGDLYIQNNSMDRLDGQNFSCLIFSVAFKHLNATKMSQHPHSLQQLHIRTSGKGKIGF